ncbi:MAG: hypothetical protein M3403_07780, partial [Gemmatimonadota bacterium]|nr:hypothetical protein [Gemmatimonadota bacterium]
WEIIELSTPGMFDAEIVRREYEGRSGEAWPRVVRHLIGNLASTDHGALQEYLQKNRLASFARLTARKL